MSLLQRVGQGMIDCSVTENTVVTLGLFDDHFLPMLTNTVPCGGSSQSTRISFICCGTPHASLIINVYRAAVCKSRHGLHSCLSS